jgi:catechol 2,3-dioxygenase-like lactoylglutathione lyase family enzyme
MTLYIGSTVVNSHDIERGIAFWTAALGYVVRGRSEDFAVLTDPNRRWSNLSLQYTEEVKVGRNRVHIDLYTDDRDAEVERLIGLGATRIPWEYDEGDVHIVLADPDGNEFCVCPSTYAQD